MTRWERLEEYLSERELVGGEFTARKYAKDMEFDQVVEATWDIQAYLNAQRSAKSTTEYVLRRRTGTRTCNARWIVGTKSDDARGIGKGLHSDTRRRVQRAFRPDLERIKALNPRAAKLVSAQIDAVIDGALKILEVAAQGYQDGTA
jgi:hypothetical protein